METYTIVPILIGKLEVDLGIMTYRTNYGRKEYIPIISWYIKGCDKNILVDTGISAEMSAIYTEAKTQDLIDFEEGLNQVGICSDEVDLVIQTHLHFDHVGNTSRCKRAKVIVQKSEVEFALAPHPMQGYLYDPSLIRNLRCETINGDHAILPGIEVIHLPSHTPGVQAVSINTIMGKAVISGICCIGANFDVPPPTLNSHRKHYWNVVPPGNFINLYDAYSSMLKLKGIADILIPQHDPFLFNLKEIPSPEMLVGTILGCHNV